MRTLVLLLLAVPAFADDKADKKALAGTWIIEKAVIEGAEQAALKDATLVLEDGKYTFTLAGSVDKGTTTIDSSKTPKTMDVVGTEGVNKDKTYPCIYELKDGTLTVCYGMDPKTRPTKFETAKDSKTMLVTYKKKG